MRLGALIVAGFSLEEAEENATAAVSPEPATGVSAQDVPAVIMVPLVFSPELLSFKSFGCYRDEGVTSYTPSTEMSAR